MCGDPLNIRAIIDPGAEASLISDEVVNILCLSREFANVVISGVGATPSGVAKMKSQVTVLSHVNSEFSLRVSVLILDKLTVSIPGCTVNTRKWSHISNIRLADPAVCKPARIDCILGVDVYNYIILEGVVRGPSGPFVAQETRFG